MIDKTLFWTGWAIVLGAFVTWLLPLTWLFFRPNYVEISGGQVTLQRSFPGDVIGLPRPVMGYVETIRPLTPEHNGGHGCQQTPAAPFRYSSTEPVGTWILDWAAECINDPVGFTWEARWSAYIGPLALGPVSLSTIVFSETTG